MQPKPNIKTYMFGDLLGNADKMQAEMRSKLKAETLSVSLEGIHLEENASGEGTNLSIDESLTNADSKEKLEDLLVESINRFFLKVKQSEAELSAKMLKDMLPPGFENMFK
ncbi:MAG: YbaB/EbfC family nucleoid-associated protein [Saprospiraceae bacterium]|nr:YbaB/EbfC family nucleoid-associated protein [Saprospiraceae bacterium]